MSWKITFEIIGDTLSPRKLDIDFDYTNEPDDIDTSGNSKGSKYGYGSASYIVPHDFTRLNKFKHLADTFEPLLEELKSCGAENWYISIDRLYFIQCNEEFGAEEIAQIARLKCSLSYSTYSVSEEEERTGFRTK